MPPGPTGSPWTKALCTCWIDCAAKRKLIQPGGLSTSATERDHRALAEDAKAVLAARVRETVRLEQIALALAVSPFHLCRVFRAQTGYTLHGFQTELRLRMALDQLDAFHGDLAGLAVDLGFAHHSHLTRSFRRAFGSTPSDG